MILYPAIDLKNGKCVRLIQGKMNKETVFNHDPLLQAKSFVDQGCEWLHLIDLDGGGSLDAEEMMKLMDMLGMLAMEEEVIELIEQIDSTGDGEVYFEDFVEATNKKVEVDYKAKDVIK